MSIVYFDLYFHHLIACFSEFNNKIFHHMEYSFLNNWQQLRYGWHFSPLYIEVFSHVPDIALVESSTCTAF